MFTNPDLNQTVYVWAVIEMGSIIDTPEDCCIMYNVSARARILLSEDKAKECAIDLCRRDYVNDVRIALFSEELSTMVGHYAEGDGYSDPLIVIDYDYDRNSNKLTKRNVYVRADVKENM